MQSSFLLNQMCHMGNVPSKSAQTPSGQLRDTSCIQRRMLETSIHSRKARWKLCLCLYSYTGIWNGVNQQAEKWRSAGWKGSSFCFYTVSGLGSLPWWGGAAKEEGLRGRPRGLLWSRGRASCVETINAESQRVAVNTWLVSLGGEVAVIFVVTYLKSRANLATPHCNAVPAVWPWGHVQITACCEWKDWLLLISWTWICWKSVLTMCVLLQPLWQGH